MTGYGGNVTVAGGDLTIYEQITAMTRLPTYKVFPRVFTKPTVRKYSSPHQSAREMERRVVADEKSQSRAVTAHT